MKRNSVPVILILIAFYLAVGILLGIVAAKLLHVTGGNWCLPITVFIVFIFFFELTNLLMFPFARKTMNKGLEANNFGKTYTFINKGSWSIRTILCIDEGTGRIAYTSALNPFKFQMAEAKELSKVRTSYIKGPFGGTKYVFFEFYYGNNRMRIPTFAKGGRLYLSMYSKKVQEALAEGEKVCNLILKFNPQGNLTLDQINQKEMPFIKIGIPGTVFAGVSVFISVIAMLSEAVISSSEGWKDDLLNGMPAFVLAFLGLATSVTGLILGIKGLKAAAEGPVRGLGFSKTAVIMSSIVIVLLILTFILFIA
ncbi:MAG: DUF4190 domain-containing protein [Clostridiales bacterium]|nr:DUF4190 domain-containing protein [Clostridiales bacterium]